jgi:hypothetical protein
LTNDPQETDDAYRIPPLYTSPLSVVREQAELVHPGDPDLITVEQVGEVTPTVCAHGARPAAQLPKTGAAAIEVPAGTLRQTSR